MSTFVEQEEDKKAASQKRIAAHLDGARRAVHGSISHATATVEALDNQKETLDSIEDHLESHEAAIDKSLRTIRGMTWAGAFYNAYSDVVSTIVPVSESEKEKETLQDTKTPSDSVYEQYIPEKNPPITSETSEEEKALAEISAAATSLKRLTLTMGKQLNEQNTQLDNIEKKSDKVHDKTLAATLKASQLTQKQSKKDIHVGTYQFMHISNSLLLSTRDDNLELTNSADLSTLFRVILRQETIVGLQSELTGKFIGITMFGSIAVSGNYFGSQEELFLDINGNDTGILFLSKNWGAGGWLKLPSVAPENVNHPAILTETTKSAGDKENRILLKAIKSSSK
jgi:uncharacterized protein Yka (UPF0111/DUF47 family)